MFFGIIDGMSKDKISRFVIQDSSIRGNIIKLNNSLNELRQSLPIPPQVLGPFEELMTVSPMLAATLKFEGGLILQIQGKNDLKLIIAESDHNFNIRGTVKLKNETIKPFDELLKNSIFALSIVHKDQKAPYQGIIDVKSGNIKEMIEGYLTQSMQIKSRIFFNQHNGTSYGVLFQEMPHVNEDHAKSTNRLWETIENINKDKLSENFEDTLSNIFPDEVIEIFEDHQVTHQCSCSEEKILKTISLINPTEIYESVKNDTIEMICEYCQKKYVISKADIDIIFNKNDQLLN